MKTLIASVLVLFTVLCNAQTTPNLITNNWTGTTATTSTGGGFSGGNVPGYNASTNTIMFGYNQATVAQTYAINQALSGSGVQIGGYNYSWQYLNNGSTGGTLSSNIKLTSPTGSTLESYNYAMNTVADGWRTMSGTQNFNQQYGLADVGNLSISFTGKDARWWAGLYGPQVKDVNLSLNYTVDPCVANPLYSPSCANFNQVLKSDAIYAQSYAINQALNLSGSGVQINGLEYGYHYYVGGQWCAAGFIICWDYRPSSMDVNVNVTSNTGETIYSATHSHTEQDTGGTPSYSYVFSKQRPISTMGNFSLTTNEIGSTALYSSWSKWLYTPDPCVVDPTSSTTCAGYAAAYKTQQCSINPFYATDCPGYQQAYQTQQCSISALYSPSCAGYAQAFHNQQCTANALYATDCPGYQQAYHDQQCSVSALYATDCIGYAAAFKAEQCSISALYATDCPGYAEAYKTQQCTANALYATDCPGYAAAYKVQQCTASPLYATDCPGYAEALFKSNCIKDSLFSPNCEGYKTAYAIKYLTPLDPVVTSAVNSKLTDMVEVFKADPANAAPSTTGSSTVDSVLTTPSTTSATSTSPASPTSVLAPKDNTGGAMNSPAPAKENKQEDKPQEKKTDSKMAALEKKSGGNNREDVKKEIGEKGKQLADEVGKAKSLEAQQAVQGQIVGVMNFVPGFSAYSNAMVPDTNALKMAKQYDKPVVDNRSAQRYLNGASDAKWQTMVDSQYKLGN